MSSPRAYPPVSPRLVAAAPARKRANAHIAASSRRARARWAVAQTPGLGSWLWRPPTADVETAWELGLRFLAGDPQTVVGVLGEPGPEQRLTLIPAAEGVVVKVAVHEEGDPVIERERMCLDRLAATPWRDLGPRSIPGGPAETTRAVLLMDRMVGEHPLWDDSAVHERLLRQLSQAANGAGTALEPGLHHGDVAPWNVFCAADGSLTLVDWEFADFAQSSPPICGVLDFVLRGAVVSRARTSRVRSVLLETLALAGLGDGRGEEAIDHYRHYRGRIRAASDGRPDSLDRASDDLLAVFLSPEPS